MLWQIALAILIVYLLRQWISSNPNLDGISGPPKWPIVGSALTFVGYSQTEIFDLLTEFPKKYGNITCVKAFNRYILHVYDPKHVEIVLSNSKNITKNKPYTFMEPWLGTGLLLSTGDKWHRRRKILTPAFHFEILKSFAKVFEEESRNMVRDLQTHLKRGEDQLDVMPFISDYTLYTICETAMGTRLNSGDNETKMEYKQTILDIGATVITRLSKFWLHSDFIFSLTPIGQKFKKYLEKNSHFTNNVIENRRKQFLSKKEVTNNGGSEDNEEMTSSRKKRSALLDLLLDAESRGEIDMAGIREEVNTFMFEGHDTTAMALTFGLMLLAEHEDVQEQIFEECKTIFGDSSRTATITDLAEMKYLEAVIKEVLRIYPSVPLIGRNITEDFMLDNISVPKGTEVVVNIYNLHRREDIFPEPEEFKPERFLSGDRLHFSYVPFSAGPRNCIGQRYALQELKYMLSEIVRHFKLSPAKKGFRPKIKADLVLRTTDPIYVKFSSR